MPRLRVSKSRSSTPTNRSWRFKEIIFMVSGEAHIPALSLKAASQVQRVPETEFRVIHTSTVTVAVLPEAEEVDIEINPPTFRLTPSGQAAQVVSMLTRPNP